MVSQIIFAMKLQCVLNNQPHTHHFKKFCVSAEISFLFGGRQLATVSALTTCSLFTLSLQEFQEIEEEFPHVVNELRGVALMSCSVWSSGGDMFGSLSFVVAMTH